MINDKKSIKGLFIFIIATKLTSFTNCFCMEDKQRTKIFRPSCNLSEKLDENQTINLVKHYKRAKDKMVFIEEMMRSHPEIDDLQKRTLLDHAMQNSLNNENYELFLHIFTYLKNKINFYDLISEYDPKNQNSLFYRMGGNIFKIISYYDAKLLKIAIDNGVDLSILQPLHRACLKENFEEVRYLIEETDAKRSIRVVDENLDTPLHIACLMGNYKIVRFLIENFAWGTHNKKHHDLRNLVGDEFERKYTETEEKIIKLLDGFRKFILSHYDLKYIVDMHNTESTDLFNCIIKIQTNAILIKIEKNELENIANDPFVKLFDHIMAKYGNVKCLKLALDLYNISDTNTAEELLSKYAASKNVRAIVKTLNRLKFLDKEKEKYSDCLIYCEDEL